MTAERNSPPRRSCGRGAGPGLEAAAGLTRPAAGVVTPAALGALLRGPVPVDGWTEGQAMPPGAIVQDCDVFLIAPASATTLAWCASGAAANIVAASYLAHTGRASGGAHG